MNIRRKKFYIGLDVHKRFTSYCVIDFDGNIISEGNVRSTGKSVHQALEPYLFSSIIGLETNMEIYPIYDYFKSISAEIYAANVIQLRKLICKNDRLDAIRLADMLRLNSFPKAYMPSGTLKNLRQMVKSRHKCNQELTRIKNQLKSFTRKKGINFGMQKPFTNKWNKQFNLFLKKEKIYPDILNLHEHFLYSKKRLEKLTQIMINYCKLNFEKEFSKIMKIKGIGEILTTYYVSEICPINRFASIKKLRRYAGVIPVSSESGGKMYGSYLPKTSSRGLLRWALVQGVHCAKIHNEKLKQYYTKKKKEKKYTGKAQMCVASSLSDLIYKKLSE